jgi:NADPH-dependent ferric siderophore reductase
MQRVVLQSPDLADFRSDAYDDPIRVFLPPHGQELNTGAPPPARDYTPRAFDAAASRLTVDFVLHGHGPASTWAASARPGDHVGIAGPANSHVVRGAYDWYLLAGDETALPAIGRRIEELPAGARVLAFIEIADAAERQTFAGEADADIRWLERDGREPGDPDRLLAALAAATLPPGDAFAFVACENTPARALRRHLVEERGFAGDRIKAYRFWLKGAPDLGQS